MVALQNPVFENVAEDNEALFARLYESAFLHVAGFVSKHNGTLQEAKDIFQDALVVFYEKYVAGNVHVTVSEEAYLLGIAKHLWIRKFNRGKSTVSLDSTALDIDMPDDFYESVEENRLMSLLERAGRKCLDLLKAVYYDKAPMKKIKNNSLFQQKTVNIISSLSTAIVVDYHGNYASMWLHTYCLLKILET